MFMYLMFLANCVKYSVKTDDLVECSVLQIW